MIQICYKLLTWDLNLRAYMILFHLLEIDRTFLLWLTKVLSFILIVVMDIAEELSCLPN